MGFRISGLAKNVLNAINLGTVEFSPDVEHKYTGDEKERHNQNGHRSTAKKKNKLRNLE